jgi:hypothetical protein
MSYWADGHRAQLFIELLERCFIFQFGMLVRRRAYESLGPFREDLLRSQDYEMLLRLTRRFAGAYVGDAPLFLQRVHDGERGGGLDRFSAAASGAKWLAYDKKIFEGLLGQLDLSEITPCFARGLAPPKSRRAALLQRACIWGRHGLWTNSVDDYAAAAETANSSRCSPDEAKLAGRVFSEIPAVEEFLASEELIARLVSLRQHPFGRSLLRALARGLLWQVRFCLVKAEYRGLLARLSLLGRLVGLRTSDLLGMSIP